MSKPRLKLIVNCGPCEDYIGSCLASVREQTYTNWEAHLTIDPGGDRTGEAAEAASGGDPRIHITHNPARLYSMRNLISGVQRCQAAPDDVVVVLDGDDWFATNRALEIIASTYEQHDCWATYGSWVSNDPSHVGMPYGKWPAYPEGTTDFRQHQWLGTAVRTWKRWIWDLIDDQDFRDWNGNYFVVTEDRAAMLPILEMSGTERARHIPEIIMIYNRLTPHACGRLRHQEGAINCAYFQTKRPYPRLHARPVNSQSGWAKVTSSA